MNEHTQAAPAASEAAPETLAERIRAGLLLAIEHAPADMREAVRKTLAAHDAETAFVGALQADFAAIEKKRLAPTLRNAVWDMQDLLNDIEDHEKTIERLQTMAARLLGKEARA